MEKKNKLSIGFDKEAFILKSGGSKISTRGKIVEINGISVRFFKANFPKNQIFSKSAILRGFKRFFKSIAESINNLRKETGNILDLLRVKTVQIFNYMDVLKLDSCPVDNFTKGWILSITKNGTFYLPFTLREILVQGFR